MNGIFANKYWRLLWQLSVSVLTIVSYFLVVRIFAAFGHSLLFSSSVALVIVSAGLYLFLKIVSVVRRRLLWRLRNRLIVAYIFIAVVPVILISAMVGIGMYLLYLQFGAHLLNDDLQTRINTIAGYSESIANAIDREAAQSTAPLDQSVLARPAVASLISAARSQWPSHLDVFWNGGRAVLKANGNHFAGFTKFNGVLWFAAADARQYPGGRFSILVGGPLNSAMLEGLPSDLGPIQLTLLSPVARRPATGLSFNIGGQVYVPGQQIATSQRHLAPRANWFDVLVRGGSTFVAYGVALAPDAETSPAPVLASFALRPSTLNKSLFTSVGAVGPILLQILLGTAIVFVVLEIAALGTGVVLTRTITRSVSDLYEGTLRVRRGDFSHRIRVQKRDQLGALGESFNEMTSSVAELIVEQRKRQRLEHEIDIAREVQQQLFPQSLPSLPGLELAAICRPAKVVSGDYYDFIPLGPTSVGIAIADISGKGIFAALLMASFQAALRSTTMLGGNCDETAAVVARVSRHLFKNTSDDRYATFFYAVYDSAKHRLTYTNAGHPAPFLISGDCVRQLDKGGTVVGLFENPAYVETVLDVAPGTLLVAFSDGITEPESAGGEEFGTERVKAEILRLRDAPVRELAMDLIAAAEKWSAGAEQADDMTVVAARMG
jgi:phosphoserine phosphatase RsbU/P